MQLEMLPILIQRRPFEFGGLAALKPEAAGFGDHDALAVGHVEAGAQIGRDGGVKGVGVALTVEALDAALAALIGVGDHPGLALRAVAVLPSAFAD